MQKIYFEKWIDLKHQLKELESLSVDESINYKIENVGVRAIGSLIVKGDYNQDQKFEESIELDVLAAFDKIVDQRDFNIKVEDFDYSIKEGNIQIKIEVGVHGVIDGEDRYIQDKEEPEEQPEDQLAQIESLIRQEEVPMATVLKEPEAVVEAVEEVEPVQEVVENVVLPEEKTVSEISEQLQEKVYESKSRPIFQDTKDSVGTYYLYIIKENDSYETIAMRYAIDEMVIRNYNQDKSLETGSVLIIPYVP